MGGGGTNVPRSVRSLSGESITALVATTAPRKDLLGFVGQFVHETVNLVERFVKPAGRHGVKSLDGFRVV